MGPMYLFLVSEVYLKQVLCNMCKTKRVFLPQKCNELYNSVLVLLAINKVPALNHGNRTIMLASSAERLSHNWGGCILILLRLVIEFNLIYKMSTKYLIYLIFYLSNYLIFFQLAFSNLLSNFLWLLLRTSLVHVLLSGQSVLMLHLFVSTSEP